ncbi:endogenous retroviral envelope protein HEMO-like [Gracilinanus agilis]|uniref:endogenous retroviral envelope protein HEMO-like n=1 Tax=Gracilinanus agilis TaxID=191870 RepID=UPI001CFD61EC|nr:endogenous retroviral envelope protein HEMO-like [Gracilinanus agilis]XP_044536772.1 endogenous retroviral envelope protein HEMO-like [Gracilinanus agilis]
MPIMKGEMMSMFPIALTVLLGFGLARHALPQHPFITPIQRAVTAANLTDFWVCHKVGNMETEVSLIPIPAPLSHWINESIYGVYYYSSYSKYQYMWKYTGQPLSPEYGKGLKYKVHVSRTFYTYQVAGRPQYRIQHRGQYPLCIQNDNGTVYLGDVPEDRCAQTLWFDTDDGTWEVSPGSNRGGNLKCGKTSPVTFWDKERYSNFTILPLNYTSASWKSETKNYHDDTLYVLAEGGEIVHTNFNMSNCPDESSFVNFTLIYQMFESILCGYNDTPWHHLTHSWKNFNKRCPWYFETGTLMIRGKERWSPNSTWAHYSGNRLTLSLAHTPGLYFICGDYAYKALPPAWGGTCTIAYLVPDLQIHKTLTSTPVPNLRSLINRVHKPTTNPLAEKPSGFHAFARALFPWLGILEIEKAIVNMSAAVEEGFSATLDAISNLRLEVDPLSHVVVQSRMALDMKQAQQGGVCAYINTMCCFYVDKKNQISQNVTKLKNFMSTDSE